MAEQKKVRELLEQLKGKSLAEALAFIRKLTPEEQTLLLGDIESDEPELFLLEKARQAWRSRREQRERFPFARDII